MSSITYTHNKLVGIWKLCLDQGVTKRCRLSRLTKSASYEPKCGGGVAGQGLSQWEQLCTWSPNKLWRSNSIFNLWFRRMSRGSTPQPSLPASSQKLTSPRTPWQVCLGGPPSNCRNEDYSPSRNKTYRGISNGPSRRPPYFIFLDELFYMFQTPISNRWVYI